MDLQDQKLKKRLLYIARLLILTPVDSDVSLSIYSPRPSTFGLWIVCIQISESSQKSRVLGSGVGKSLIFSFIKAVVEAGERLSIIRHDHYSNIKTRNGVAGSFFGRLAKERAFFEAVERDAFLFHYRNRLPCMKSGKLSNGLEWFELATNVESVKAVMVLSLHDLETDGSCVKIGLGASVSLDEAIQKATGEIAASSLDHVLRKGWCDKFSLDMSPEDLSWPDFHHIQSRDYRNHEILRAMCLGTEKRKTGRKMVARTWRDFKYSNLKSAVRLIKYHKIESDQFMNMEFGVPEGDSGVYHPFW